MVCGDGANDLSMFAQADTRVAFVQRCFKKEANIISRYKRFKIGKNFRTYKGLKDENGFEDINYSIWCDFYWKRFLE